MKKAIFTFLILLTTLSLNAQRLVKGKVVDNNGNPVIGATVTVAGTTNGTITDLDGEYQLEVPNNSTLEVSYVGYSKQQINANATQIPDCVLSVDQSQKRGKWYFGTSFACGNFWGWALTNAANVGLAALTGKSFTHWETPYYNIKVDGEKAEIKQDFSQAFGFKRIFSHSTWGGRFGYYSPYSILNPFVSFYYNLDNFDTKFPGDVDWTENKFHNIEPGVGVRLYPGTRRFGRIHWLPVLEAGCNYNYYTKCKSIYGNDTEQALNGANSWYSVGLDTPSATILLGVRIFHHDLYNKDYSPDDGATLPFANVSSKPISILLTTTFNF